ncbi:peptidase [Cedecea davisae]|uniref:Peptidase n=1 Tax=Cedecea davisae TaxID=158484 RepID=A0ABS6DED9_9ENTR|nr:peptidase [Cedecea davisae]MBU4681211.1 peptidase [Cedecea davisae]MBU4685056.1 peptidase [Cedecea davisae]
MNLFERLMFRRLCNEQPGDGGAAPAASEPAGAAGDKPAGSDAPASQEGDKPTGSEGDNPQGDKPAEGDKPADKEQKPEGAPEKYEFKAAEGQELDQVAIKEFEPIARELNLTNEQAQKFVDVYASKILPQMQQQQVEKWTQQTEQWASDVKADKEIGGDNMTANVGLAQKAFDQFGSPELKEYLNTTGLGNHPEIIRAFMKVGKAMSEDDMVMTSNSGQRSAAEVLYGK